MFGVRIGKKFNNVAMKPSLTLWYDHLSGTDDGDVGGNELGEPSTPCLIPVTNSMDSYGSVPKRSPKCSERQAWVCIDFAIQTKSIQPDARLDR